MRVVTTVARVIAGMTTILAASGSIAASAHTSTLASLRMDEWSILGSNLLAYRESGDWHVGVAAQSSSQGTDVVMLPVALGAAGRARDATPTTRTRDAAEPRSEPGGPGPLSVFASTIALALFFFLRRT